jgi:hypothetical protein
VFGTTCAVYVVVALPALAVIVALPGATAVRQRQVRTDDEARGRRREVDPRGRLRQNLDRGLADGRPLALDPGDGDHPCRAHEFGGEDTGRIHRAADAAVEPLPPHAGHRLAGRIQRPGLELQRLADLNLGARGRDLHAGDGRGGRGLLRLLGQHEKEREQHRLHLGIGTELSGGTHVI